jgi:hypothetical protein
LRAILPGSGAPELKNNQSKFNAFKKGNPWETTTIHWKQSYFINLMLSGVKVQTEFRQQYARARERLSDWFQISFSCTREGGIEKQSIENQSRLNRREGAFPIRPSVEDFAKL